MNETEQVTRAQGGDEMAWRALIRQHQDAVFRLAYLLLHDEDDAADVTQETFIRALRGLDRFDTTRPLRPWLLEIARNQCYNWSRALRRRWAAWQRWGAAEPTRAIAPSTIDPNEQVVQQATATRLWQAVRRLPERDQEVIYLRCFLELSGGETAQVLKIAPGTVKSRLSRAMARLRGIITQDFPDLQRGATE